MKVLMNSDGFKDLFSRQSSEYARFRPTYPEALFDFLSSRAPALDCAWDCGTGNGQAAVRLAERFERVVATDPSEKQLASAIRHPKVEYRRASAEESGLPDRSVDLLTVAQAFHWFRQDRFFAEAGRVLRPKGVLAIWCYELARVTPEVDAVVMRLYRDVLGPYWEKERKLVEEGYRSVRAPFEELPAPKMEMSAEWSLEHLVGYLGTWSALQTYLKSHAENPLETFFPELRAAWGSFPSRSVSWELGLRVWRV